MCKCRDINSCKECLDILLNTVIESKAVFTFLMVNQFHKEYLVSLFNTGDYKITRKYNYCYIKWNECGLKFNQIIIPVYEVSEQEYLDL